MATRPERGRGGKGGNSSTWGWIIGAVVLAILAFVLIQLFNEEQSAGPEAGVTVSDIADNPQEYYGSTVTVSGEVGELIGPRAFTLGAEDDLGGGSLLIVGAQQLLQIMEGEADEITAQDVAQVTGPVREFNLAEVEDEIGADLDDALFAEFEGQPAVVANTTYVTAGASGSGEQNAQATLANITDNPDEYYGQSVTVDGAVGETLEPNAFVLLTEQAAENEELLEGDPAAVEDEGVLVVSASPQPNLTELQSVQVSGMFHEFDLAVFEEELGVELDYLYRDWSGQPAILAQDVQQASQ